jgi:hypothetical protein
MDYLGIVLAALRGPAGQKKIVLVRGPELSLKLPHNLG